MNFKKILLLAGFVSMNAFAVGKDAANPREFVPDSKTAIKIAEAVLVPIYGEKVLKERPFKAVLQDDVWTVEGSVPENIEGGAAIVKLKRSSGEVLSISHGK